MSVPTEGEAVRVAQQALGGETRTVARFSTGLQHYVYEVTLADGRRVVVRLADAQGRAALAGGIHWHGRLRAVGVPVPALLYADANPASGYPVMVLERLPGRDLAFEYANMTAAQKRTLAGEIADIQRRVATLPRASGYGFACSYDDAALQRNRSWLDVVLADLERSRSRILAAGVVDVRLVDDVARRVRAHEAYLRGIAPRAFLDDTTTKNVLIHEGRLSGIVDTDCVCFGDPLFTVALTRMALLAHGHATDYITYWCDAINISPAQERALDLYTAVFCVGFLGELGQRFNRAEADPVDDAYRLHLEAILHRLLDGEYS